MYSPKLRDYQIKRIYVLAKEMDLPMTKIVEMAIDSFLEKYDKSKKNEKQRISKS